MSVPLWLLTRYQGHVGAALVVGGVDSTGPHLYTIHPHGSTDTLPYVSMGEFWSGGHNAKAEECTIPRIGSRNIKIKIEGAGCLVKNSYRCCYSCRVPAILSASPSL